MIFEELKQDGNKLNTLNNMKGIDELTAQGGTYV